MKRQTVLAILALPVLLALPTPAAAYIGPGLGAGAFAVAAAMMVGVLLLAAGLVWYPLKRLLRRAAPPSPDAGDRGST